MLSWLGKSVTYNDYLEANAVMAQALIKNQDVRLEAADVEFVLKRQSGREYDDFIERTFEDVYFTTPENA